MVPAVAGRSEMGACLYHFCEYLAVDGIQYADVLREYAEHSQDLPAEAANYDEPDRRMQQFAKDFTFFSGTHYTLFIMGMWGSLKCFDLPYNC